MAETKKRVRPTWTMVRELEGKVKVLQEDNATMLQSNKLMEDELKRMRTEVSFHESIADDRAAEVFRLRNRNWWQRLFNL